MLEEAQDLKEVRLPGVSLRYLDRGSGDPIVLVHGGFDDYRSWMSQVGPLSRRHRVIAYSRRYNHPNPPLPAREDYSAAVDARDLLHLLETLRAAPAHLVGASYGGVGVLLLALRRPDLVRSLTLAEAPLLSWLPDLPGGASVYETFQANVWEPVRRAFRAQDVEAALRAMTETYAGPGAFEALPPEYHRYLRDNAREWEVLSAARDPFPHVPPEAVKALRLPVLFLSGERTIDAHRLVDEELERLLPGSERVIIPGAAHDVWTEAPEACRMALERFLRGRASPAPARG